MFHRAVTWSALAVLALANRASDASPPLAILIDASVDADLRQCVDIRDKGATAGNSLDDDGIAITAAIRDALAGSAANPRVVCVPAGVYDVKSTINLGDPFGTGAPATDLTIVGDGPASILKMGSGSPLWSLFQIDHGAARIRIRNLTLDGTGSNGAGLVRIGTGDLGAANGAANIDLVDLILQGAPGDALTLQGDGNTPNVQNVSVSGSAFLGNGHSAIRVLEGTRQISITSNLLSGDGDADIATGFVVPPTQGAPIAELLVSANTFVRTAPSPIALSLLGNTGTHNSDAVVTANVVVAGRMSIDDWDRITIGSNTILGGTQATSDPELSIQHGNKIAVTSNQLVRQTSTAGTVLAMNAGGNSGVAAALVDENLLYQSSAATIAQVLATDVSCTGNYFGFAGPGDATAGVAIGPSGTLVSYVRIARNLVDGHLAAGALSAAFSIGTGDGVYPPAMVIENLTRGTTYGVAVPASSADIPLVTNNLFEGVTSDITGTPRLPIAVGGNRLGPTQLTGDGSPEGAIAAAPGSIYLRRDGAANTTLYVKESGSLATGWVAK